MKPEPGIDLSNPEPEITLDEHQEQVLEMLNTRRWHVDSIARSAPMQDTYIHGNPIVARVPMGPGSTTITITVLDP